MNEEEFSNKGIYLIKVVEEYRVPDDGTAQELEKQFRQDSGFTLTKWSKVEKETKDDFFIKITCTKEFTQLTNPDRIVSSDYNVIY